MGKLLSSYEKTKKIAKSGGPIQYAYPIMPFHSEKHIFILFITLFSVFIGNCPDGCNGHGTCSEGACQ